MKWKSALAAGLLMLVPVLASCAEPDATTGDSQDLTANGGKALFGDWTSNECESVDASTYQLRTYRFSSKGVTAFWERFSDPTCAESSKLMTITMSGTSKVTGLSHTVLGAANITVFIAHKSITPTDAGVAVVEKACGNHSWVAGQDEDVTADGCGAIVPAESVCPAEYDIIKLSHFDLYFGDRSHTLCSVSTRPTKLSPWGIGFQF